MNEEQQKTAPQQRFREIGALIIVLLLIAATGVVMWVWSLVKEFA